MSFHKTLGIHSRSSPKRERKQGKEESRITRHIKLTVNDNLCKGCGICILFCPTKILQENKPTAWGGHSPCLIENGEMKCMLVRGKQGVECRLCEKRCPDAAIMIKVIEE